MTTNQHKTVTAPDGQQLGVVGAGDPVIGLRILDTNAEFLLPAKTRITLGTDDDCDIVLKSPYASSLHCVLERQERGILLVDQNSKNGTWRGEHRAEQFEVEVGVMFTLGTLPLIPFGERSRQTRHQIQRFVGFDNDAQQLVDRFLRTTRCDDHLLVVGEVGSRRNEIARLIHHTRNTYWLFLEMTRAPPTANTQSRWLKSALAIQLGHEISLRLPVLYLTFELTARQKA